MNLTDAQVREVADLANLELTEDEVRRMSHDLSQVLTHIDQLNELDTKEVEPMAQVLYSSAHNGPQSSCALYDADETATLREDVPHVCLSNDDALANAAQKGAGLDSGAHNGPQTSSALYFKVPKVIER